MSEIPVLILLLFLIAVFLRLDFAFYLVYVLFGVYVASHWWTARGLRAIEVRRRFADHAFLGERVTVELELHNGALLPIPWLRLQETVPLALHTPSFVRQVTSLRPHGRSTIRYELDCRRRGYYPLGPLHVTSGDLFGFAEAERRVGAGLGPALTDHLTVYPQIIPLTRLGFPSQSPFGTIKSGQRIFEDPARVTGVRDYRIGDSLRHIHWKTSARQDALLVKQYEPAISLQTAVFLNLNQGEYDRRRRMDTVEWAIVVAASIASHLVAQRQAVGLTTNGRDPMAEEGDGDRAPPPLPPRPGRLHLMKVLEVLARVEPWDTEPFAAWVQRASLPLPWGSTVVAITPGGDEETCRALHQLCRRGLNVVLVAVEPHGRFGLVRQRARQFGFTAFQVAYRRDMDRWRQ
ncbi:MAG: DUF58 domain-containing protein [Anaerolineae bacterium]|nr:DUF58 domain-containing protein [Anaerolineae bacterium]